MWEMKRAADEEGAAKFLAEGWEPFSLDATITPTINSGVIIAHKAMWFKRPIADEGNVALTIRRQIFYQIQEAFPDVIDRMKAGMTKDKWDVFSGEGG